MGGLGVWDFIWESAAPPTQIWEKLLGETFFRGIPLGGLSSQEEAKVYMPWNWPADIFVIINFTLIVKDVY